MMKTAVDLFFFSLLVFMINSSLAYKECMFPAKDKISYNIDCIVSFQCLTEYCDSYNRCSCPNETFYDSRSGLCVRRNGLISNNAGDCGYIVSPPDASYGSLSNWTIEGGPSTYVTLVLLEVQMSSNCENNYIEVLDDTGTLLNKSCSSISSILFQASVSKYILVNYKATDRYLKGFRAIYFIRGSQTVLTETAGYIASPGYPLCYPNSAFYSWLITGQKGQIISLSISLDTEYNQDKVLIYDGQNETALLIADLAGLKLIETLNSTAEYMYIVFQTDKDTCKKGFSLSYRIIGELYDSPCDTASPCIQGLSCNTNICGCMHDQYYDPHSDSCLQKATYLDYCSSTKPCLNWLHCEYGRCKCEENRYYDYSSKWCKEKALHGAFCDGTYMCINNLYCIEGECVCQKTKYYVYSFKNCTSRISYNNLCIDTRQCSEDLICLHYKCACSDGNLYDQDSETCKDNTQRSALIATTTLGWFVALVALFCCCRKCCQNCDLSKRLHEAQNQKKVTIYTLEKTEDQTVDHISLSNEQAIETIEPESVNNPTNLGAKVPRLYPKLNVTNC